MNFYEWFKNKADKELQKAVCNSVDEIITDRKNKLVDLYGVYLQQKLIKTTFWLVIVTGVLAVATIGLIIFTRSCLKL